MDTSKSCLVSQFCCIESISNFSITRAYCDCSPGSNVGKHQDIDDTGLGGMAEASHNWRIYFPVDAVSNKDRIHLGELVQLQVEVNAKG